MDGPASLGWSVREKLGRETSEGGGREGGEVLTVYLLPGGEDQ